MEFEKISEKEYRKMNRQQRKLFKKAGGEVVVPKHTQFIRVLSGVFIVGVMAFYIAQPATVSDKVTTEDEYYNLSAHACAGTIKQRLANPASMNADTTGSEFRTNSRGHKVVSFKFTAQNALGATISKTGACEIAPYDKTNTEALPSVLMAKVI